VAVCCGILSLCFWGWAMTQKIVNPGNGRSTLLDGVSKKTLLRAIATNVPENDVDGGASHSLKFGIVFMFTNSCQ
jgi:hypothetical protein